MNKQELLLIKESLQELVPNYDNIDFGPSVDLISDRKTKSLSFVNKALKNLGRIEYRKGNLLDVKEGVIIHGCNLQGVMGAGVAKAIKEKYPKCFDEYKKYLFLTESVTLGEFSTYEASPHLVIENLLTQINYGRDPRVRYVSYDAISYGFKALNKKHSETVPFYFPKIGAGLGGGNWEVIEKIIESECPRRQLICYEL